MLDTILTIVVGIVLIGIVVLPVYLMRKNARKK